jgi:hypothetical protein
MFLCHGGEQPIRHLSDARRSANSMSMNLRHAAALMLLVLAISMASCGGSNNPPPCRKSSSVISFCNSAVMGRTALPDSPYAPRQ